MISYVHTATPKLEESLEFYKKLGFSVLSEESSTILADSQCIIEINPDRFARTGVRLIKSSWEVEVGLLEAITTLTKTDDGYLLSDPSGCWIYLTENSEIDSYDISQLPPSVLGNYAGVSLECIDIDLSLNIWNLLGFKKTMGDLDQGWLSLSNESGFSIGMMVPNSCPHLFFNPSLTYFNGKENNPKVIEKIRSLEIAITEEITAFNEEGIVDNIIIRDPGGFGFFIFND